MTLLGDEIPCNAFNYGVNCQLIKLRLTSALILTVTVMSEGLFTLIEGCLFLLGTIIMVLHLILAQ